MGMRRVARFFLVLFFCLSAVSCSQEKSEAPLSSAIRGDQVAMIQARDFAAGQLEAHYRKHGYQFGNITIEQYLDQARSLLDAPAGQDIQEKIRSNGDVLRYKGSTGEFAVMSKSGRIRTYFKTDFRYWMKQ